MPETHTDKTEIVLQGKVESSLGNAANSAVNSLGRVRSTGAKASSSRRGRLRAGRQRRYL
jgi:hypothetical protein